MSTREANDIQDFWRTHGPLQQAAFLRACERTKTALGDRRPLAVLLADIARQIHGDQEGAASAEVLA